MTEGFIGVVMPRFSDIKHVTKTYLTLPEYQSR